MITMADVACSHCCGTSLRFWCPASL